MKSTYTTIALLLMAGNAYADSACEFTIFDVGLGFEADRATKILEAQGFRRIDNSTAFTNEAAWPPPGVELSDEDRQYAAFLADPQRAEALWKMAESDPDLKRTLERLPPIPDTPNKVTINLRGTGPASDRRTGRRVAQQPGSTGGSVREIVVNYIDSSDRWLGRDNPDVIEFSAVHEARDVQRWATYCSDAGARDGEGAHFDSAERLRTCATHKPSAGYFLQILVHEKTGDPCRYQYTSRGQGGEELLRSFQ